MPSIRYNEQQMLQAGCQAKVCLDNLASAGWLTEAASTIIWDKIQRIPRWNMTTSQNALYRKCQSLKIEFGKWSEDNATKAGNEQLHKWPKMLDFIHHLMTMAVYIPNPDLPNSIWNAANEPQDMLKLRQEWTHAWNGDIKTDVAEADSGSVALDWLEGIWTIPPSPEDVDSPRVILAAHAYRAVPTEKQLQVHASKRKGRRKTATVPAVAGADDDSNKGGGEDTTTGESITKTLPPVIAGHDVAHGMKPSHVADSEDAANDLAPTTLHGYEHGKKSPPMVLGSDFDQLQHKYLSLARKFKKQQKRLQFFEMMQDKASRQRLRDFGQIKALMDKLEQEGSEYCNMSNCSFQDEDEGEDEGEDEDGDESDISYDDDVSMFDADGVMCLDQEDILTVTASRR